LGGFRKKKGGGGKTIVVYLVAGKLAKAFLDGRVDVTIN